MGCEAALAALGRHRGSHRVKAGDIKERPNYWIVMPKTFFEVGQPGVGHARCRNGRDGRETAMSEPSASKPLVDGGPSDQASVRPDPQDAGRHGSQSGRPQWQDDGGPLQRPDPRPPPPAAAPGHAPNGGDEGARAVSETERRAGSPDAEVSTGNALGDGTR
jgi:hypothetical protein